MSNVTKLVESAITAAKIAVKFDQEGQKEPSIYYYDAAANILKQAVAQLDNEDKKAPLLNKITEYQKRVQTLKDSIKTEEKP